MPSVLLLLVIALLSLLIARVATVALTVTGLPRPVARFQARSALTGAGFTTSESESVVSHPVRRRIVMALMLVGNLGLATAIAGLLGGFLRAEAGAGLMRAGLLAGGLAAIYLVSKSHRVDQRMSHLIGRILSAHTDLEIRDHDRLLRLAGDYSVQEMSIEDSSWLADRRLGELRLRDEGVIVLGVIRPDGSYRPVPASETAVHPGDTLIVYGHDDAVEGLGSRPAGPAGDAAHAERAEAHTDARAAQRESDAN